MSERRQVEMRLLLCGLVAGVVTFGGAVSRSSRRFHLALTPVVMVAVATALLWSNVVSWMIVAVLIAAGVGVVASRRPALMRIVDHR